MEAGAGLLSVQAPGEFENRCQDRGPFNADAFGHAQARHVGPGHGRQRTVVGIENAAGGLHGAVSRAAFAQYDAQQLPVGERLHSAGDEFLTYLPVS